MHEYVNYCTDEQARRAWKLGAPLENFDPDNSNGIICGNDGIKAIPTTQEIRLWLLNKKGINAWVRPEYWAHNNEHRVCYLHILSKLGEPIIDDGETNNDIVHKTYEEAELAAIDAALNYLEINKCK